MITEIRDRLHKSKGLTIVEILVVAVVGTILITVAINLWQYAYLNLKEANVSYELTLQLQTCLERIKREIKISNGNLIHYYQSGGKITAISFPIAVDDGIPATTAGQSNMAGDGFIELDDNGTSDLDDDTVYWDQQVVYYVKTISATKKQLIRGVFYPRDQSLSMTDRDTQLTLCVSEGDLSDYNGDYYTKRVLIENLVDFEITKEPRTFDGYASQIERSGEIDFGSIPLTPGYHTLSFKITGKSGTGYDIGVDLFKINPCGYPREGDDYVNLTHLDGSSGIVGSVPSGNYSKEIMATGGSWSSDAVLNFNGTDEDDYVKLKFYYDLVRDTNFEGLARSNMVVELSDINGAGGVTGGVKNKILHLKGNGEAWDQIQETNDATADEVTYAASGQGNISIRNRVAGTNVGAGQDGTGQNRTEGRMVKVKFIAGPTYPFKIKDAWIGPASTAEAWDVESGQNYPIYFTNCNLDSDNSDQNVIPTNVTCKATLVADSTLNQVNAGDHYYAVVFNTAADGSGTDIINSAVSNIATADATHTQVSLTHIPLGDSTIQSRKIYRTETGGSALKRLTIISDNTTTTYNDIIPDSALGSNIPSVVEECRGVTIPADSYCWSNWTDIGINMTNDNDYLITFYIDSWDDEGNMSYADWEDTGGTIHSYSDSDYSAGMTDWTAPSPYDSIFGVEKVKVRYCDTGTYTSDIFNTYMNDPSYTEISWSQARMNSPDAEIRLRVRSNDDKDTLLADTDWSDELEINISGTQSGHSSISSLPQGRYVQFQVEMTANPSGTDTTHQTYDQAGESPYIPRDEDYDITPVLENVAIHWPGANRGISLSGIFRKDTDHGIFTIEIDDQPLTMGLTFKLSISKETYPKGVITKTSSVSVEPRNTGK